MLSLVDLLKVISPVETIEVFDIKNNITYNPRIETMPKEWIEYKVNYIYSTLDIYGDTCTVIGVEEVKND